MSQEKAEIQFLGLSTEINAEVCLCSGLGMAEITHRHLPYLHAELSGLILLFSLPYIATPEFAVPPYRVF